MAVVYNAIKRKVFQSLCAVERTKVEFHCSGLQSWHIIGIANH